MRYILFAFFSVFLVFAVHEVKADGGIDVTDAYAFETPDTMPTAAIFMTIKNNGNQDDQLVDFQIDHDVNRVELHVTEMANDIMKMRRVDHFDIPVGQEFSLHPSGSHIMVFGLQSGFVEGQSIKATARFAISGEVPVMIDVRARMAHSLGHHH